MIVYICLAWIGFHLEAPSWYFALLCFALIINVCSFGFRMYNKGKKSK